MTVEPTCSLCLDADEGRRQQYRGALARFLVAFDLWTSDLRNAPEHRYKRAWPNLLDAREELRRVAARLGTCGAVGTLVSSAGLHPENCHCSRVADEAK